MISLRLIPTRAGCLGGLVPMVSAPSIPTRAGVPGAPDAGWDIGCGHHEETVVIPYARQAVGASNPGHSTMNWRHPFNAIPDGNDP